MKALRRYPPSSRYSAVAPPVVPTTAHAFWLTMVVASGVAAILLPAAAAQDVLPTVVVDYPTGLAGQLEAVGLPSTMTFGFTGDDPDASPEGGPPTHFRYLFKTAEIPGQPHEYIATRAEYEQHYEEVLAFADTLWTPWIPYPIDPINRRIVFPNLPRLDGEGHLIGYLFAVQVTDTTGTVSVEREYGLNVVNVFVSETLAPLLTVFEPYLGTANYAGTGNVASYDILPMFELNFSWEGTADDYGAAIAAYRWGWDVADPNDPNDPGWAVAPGISPEHLQTGPMSFSSGIHTLTIRCWDDLDQLTQVVIFLEVVPIPDPQFQYPLLLVDDVFDRDSNGWPAQDGTPLDNDVYRDEFWLQTLTGPGGVVDFVPARDVIDGEETELDFRTLVEYRCAIWTSKRVAYPQSIVSRNFRPQAPGDLLVNWLAFYQQFVGNLLMVGSRNQEDFLRDDDYQVPIVLAAEDYPWLTTGLTLVDHFTPDYTICGTSEPGTVGRKSRCSGLKGLTLDTDFVDAYMPGGAAFSDTILTEPTIDWQEPDPLAPDLLGSLDYLWRRDEFYESNLSDCDIGVKPQQCPEGPCVEPMLRAVTRFGWIDQARQAAGDPDWPATEYNPTELIALCGSHAFATGYAMRAEAVPIGFFVHKTVPDKPSQKADVVWGFDPYRFDHPQVKQAIRWVLGEHFGLVMNR
jgi:hypothetical protein